MALFLPKKRGFTLFELVIVVAILGIITAATLIFLNPAQQFAATRNNQRRIHINALLNSIGQNTSDNNGTFSCSSGALPTTTKIMADNAVADSYNIAPCLVPAYLASLAYDPNASGTQWASTTFYNTGYSVYRDAVTGRVTVGAPYAELGQVISVTR